MSALNAQLTHFGIHVVNLDRMVDFYTRVMGFVISDTGKSSAGNEIFFMTQDPDCHHQFVLFDGRPKDLPFNPVNQISFRLDSIDTQNAYHSLYYSQSRIGAHAKAGGEAGAVR